MFTDGSDSDCQRMPIIFTDVNYGPIEMDHSILFLFWSISFNFIQKLICKTVLSYCLIKKLITQNLTYWEINIVRHVSHKLNTSHNTTAIGCRRVKKQYVK